MSGNRRPRLGPNVGDITVNSTDNSSGVSIGGSSLVTDVKSKFLQEHLLQRNGSISNESCMGLLAPSMPFSPNNTYGSLMMEEGSSIMQQNLPQEVQNNRTRSAAAQPTVQELVNLSNPHKRRTFDMRPNILQQQILQQFPQRHELMQPLSHQTQAMKQQRLMHLHPQLQQTMQSFTNMQKTPITLQQQGQMSQHMQQAVQLGTPVRRFFDSGICSRRLMQYLYHRRNRPSDNSIQYWRKVVTEYFSPYAKKRLCVSMYNNYGNHTPAVFPQSAVDPWRCNMCGAESGKGYEAEYLVLPQLFQVKFDDNFVDEHLFLDLPHECQLPSGIMVLEYGKVIHESVYKHRRVIHNGQLRIKFAPGLKILSWEFCVRGHEEFISRKLLASQVNQLFQVAQNYQSSVDSRGSVGVSNEDLQTICDMFVATSCQLANQLELQSLNDMGFSKRYIQCFQMYEVVSNMTDVIDFSNEQKMGPIESLRNYTQLAQKQNLGSEQPIAMHGCLPVDQNNMNNSLSTNSGMRSHMNNILAVGPIPSSNQQNVLALNDNQNFMGSTNSKQDVLQQEFSSGVNTLKQPQSTQYPGSASSILSNQSGRRASGRHRRQHPMNGKLPKKKSLHPVQGNQVQQHVIQRRMLQVMNDSLGAAQQCERSPVISSNMAIGDVSRGGSVGTAVRTESGSANNALELQNMPTSITPDPTGDAPNRSNSLETAARNASRGGCSVVTAVARDSSRSANNALELQNVPTSVTPNSTGDAPEGSNSFKTDAGSPTNSVGDDLSYIADFPEVPQDLDLTWNDDVSQKMFEGDEWLQIEHEWKSSKDVTDN